MEYQLITKSFEIYFDIFAKDDDVTDEIAFVYLIMAKFDGTAVSTHSFGKGEDKIYDLKIKFDKFEAASNAQGHCNRNIKNGKILNDYRGALDAADPRRVFSSKLQADADANPN